MTSWIWLSIGLVLVASEFVIPEFVVFFFGLGALAVGVVTVMAPAVEASLGLQLLLWAGFSAASLFLLRRTFSRLFRGTVLTRKRNSEHAGKTARVLETISPDAPGRISFLGTTWTAISYDEAYQPGETVEILEQDGSSYLVTRSLFSDESGPDHKTERNRSDT